MAGSRKQVNRLLSPYRGTGRYLQYIRCPCCGKLARGQAIGNAGTHQLTISQCIRKLPGYRTGWEWGHDPPSREHLGALEESLERALAQVRGLLGEAEVALPPEVLREFHLQPAVLSEWYFPGDELKLEVSYGNGEEGSQNQEDEEGAILRPRRLYLNHV